MGVLVEQAPRYINHIVAGDDHPVLVDFKVDVSPVGARFTPFRFKLLHEIVVPKFHYYDRSKPLIFFNRINFGPGGFSARAWFHDNFVVRHGLTSYASLPTTQRRPLRGVPFLAVIILEVFFMVFIVIRCLINHLS